MIPLPLSRRDRAAMVLALCECRQHVDPFEHFNIARAALNFGDLPPRILLAVWDSRSHVPWRLLRARLALLLRAVLRADSGDFGQRREPRSAP